MWIKLIELFVAQMHGGVKKEAFIFRPSNIINDQKTIACTLRYKIVIQLACKKPVKLLDTSHYFVFE